MKLINILLDFETLSNTQVLQSCLTTSCLSALNIVNKNSNKSRGVLVRENDHIVLYPENRKYNGYIIDFRAYNSNSSVIVEFQSLMSSANISTQIGYQNGEIRGNMTVTKCDESMNTQLVFYGAQINNDSDQVILLRAVININRVSNYSSSSDLRCVISSFDADKRIVPIVMNKKLFDYMYANKSYTCQAIYSIMDNDGLRRDHELEYGLELNQLEFDSSLSYTSNDLL